MSIDFESLLVAATLLTGLVTLLNKLIGYKRQPEMVTHNKILIWVNEQSRSFFPILLVVLILRSFLFEPFRIPTGSLEPTLEIGDFIVVNKFIYGLRLPTMGGKIINIKEPKRGDIVVFRHPIESVDYIKRVIGLPGDQISYINKVLYINGQEAPQTFLGYSIEKDSEGDEMPVIEKEENLAGVRHKIFLRKDSSAFNVSLLPNQSSWVVPKGEYFMMGDNRDNSFDSRYWGFVPESHLKGQALMVWFHWDHQTHHIGWNRIGKRI